MRPFFRVAGALCASAAAALASVGEINPVPEPGTLLLLAGGLATLILVVRHRKKK